MDKSLWKMDRFVQNKSVWYWCQVSKCRLLLVAVPQFKGPRLHNGKRISLPSLPSQPKPSSLPSFSQPPSDSESNIIEHRLVQLHPRISELTTAFTAGLLRIWTRRKGRRWLPKGFMSWLPSWRLPVQHKSAHQGCQPSTQAGENWNKSPFFWAEIFVDFSLLLCWINATFKTMSRLLINQYTRILCVFAKGFKVFG